MKFLITDLFPLSSSIEAGEKFFKSASQPLPPVIKKWETYMSDDGSDGTKGYHLIKTDRDKADEAMVVIRQQMAPMATIEGFKTKIETLFGIKETANLMKFMK